MNKTGRAVSAELPSGFHRFRWDQDQSPPSCPLGPRPVKQSPVSCPFDLDTGTKGTDPRNGCPIFGRVVPRTKFSGRYPQYLVSLIWTVSCRCLGYVILDYLFACGYIFLFTSAAGVDFPVSGYFNSAVFHMFFAFQVRKSPAFR